MIESLILLIIILLFVIFYVLFLLIKIEKKHFTNSEIIELLKQTNHNQRSVDESYRQNLQMFNDRLDKVSSTLMGVNRSIGEFTDIGRSMRQLQDFLQSPKLRGNIGEQVLKDLLFQCLPESSYELQYQFLSGERVDAVIKTSQGMIVIDSKFPISSFRNVISSATDTEKTFNKKEFQKDVKKHITSISKKYILPAEGTLDYALMYVPAESVYYEIISDDEISDFVTINRVIPVSPMSFYAYLKVILISLEGQKIHSKVKDLIRSLTSMKNDFVRVDDAVALLYKHLSHAYSQGQVAVDEVSKLGRKIENATALSFEQEKLKP